MTGRIGLEQQRAAGAAVTGWISQEQQEQQEQQGQEQGLGQGQDHSQDSQEQEEQAPEQGEEEQQEIEGPAVDAPAPAASQHGEVQVQAADDAEEMMIGNLAGDEEEEATQLYEMFLTHGVEKGIAKAKVTELFSPLG